MVIIDERWNNSQRKRELTYLANTPADVVLSELDPECAIGSSVLVVSDESVYIKNTAGKWQKSGSAEVLA